MLLKTAQDLHAAGRLPEAIALYERVLAMEPRNYDANYLLGIALYQAGRAEAGTRHLKAATEIRPAAIEALRDLGIISLKLRDYAGAEAALARAMRLEPRNAQFAVNRGIALKNLGRLEEAALCQRTALALQPDFAEAHHQLASVLLALDRPAEALESFRRATTAKPALAEAWQGAGQALLELQQPAEALSALQHAVKLNPSAPDTRRALALALLRAGHDEEALRTIEEALSLDPGQSGSLAAKGAILERLQDRPAALAAYDAALAKDPDDVDAMLGRAGLLRGEDAVDEALDLYDRAIALAPRRGDTYFGAGQTFMRKREFAAAARSFDEALKYLPRLALLHHQRGAALRELGFVTAALEAYDAAIAADPAYIDSYLAKAMILSDEHRWEDALEVLEAARVLDTEKDRGLGQRFGNRMQICDWTGYERDLRLLVERVAEGDDDLSSFNSLAHLDDPALQKRYVLRSSHRLAQRALPARRDPPAAGDGRITIAYVSGDFRDHATMYLMADVFEHHDRSRFRIIALSLKKVANSTMRARVEPFFDAFHDVDDLTDREILALARQEGVEIAADLMGFTQFARPSLFAAKLAPVQANYLGYAGTTGLTAMDYVIADPVLIPEQSRQHYTEKVAYLPDSYQPNDRKRAIAEGGNDRAQHGLPENAFVFCCFNNNFKITPAVFDSWMRILAAAPDSVLWLFSYAAVVESNLRAAAAARGIDPERLVFAKRLPLPDHLARHRAADLFLDTLPYNAHTTASDALWAGVPVLTLMGETFASRVAGSLVTAAGLPELIAPNREAYEKMAVGFYNDRESLRALRRKLADQIPHCALFDAQRYTRKLETLFEQMAERQRRGLPPDHLFA